MTRTIIRQTFQWLRHVCLAIGMATGITGMATAQAGHPPIRIYAPDWGLTLKADGTGFYNDLVRFLFAGQTEAINYEIKPYRRTNRTFFEDPTSCKFPTNFDFLINSGILKSREGYIEGRPLLVATVRLFSPPGTPPPRSKEDARGKSVAYAMGASTPGLFGDIQVFFIAVADEVDKAAMLLNGRVDYLTATLPDAEFVFRELKTDLAPFDPDLAIDISPLYFACHDTPVNASFLKRLDGRIDHLITSGKLAAFFREQGLDPALYLPR